ncbi:MAG TPA: glutamyl-tRNA reductase [Chthoniobacterales bacterium]
MNLSCLGLSHHTANVGVRERFVVPDGAMDGALQRLRQVPGVDEAVILSTCNRTEFYVAGNVAHFTPDRIIESLWPSASSQDLSCVYHLSGGQTARHLFRVTAGLESMAVGETEVFGQVKRAYQAAVRLGATGKYLNRLFQKSFQVGKQVRSTTGITKGSISVGSVAVDLATQIFGSLKGCKVMLLGAGETSERTARSFHSRAVNQIFVSNRSFERAEKLAESVNGRAIRFDAWEREFIDVDILVSSTAAPHTLVTVAKLEPALRRRRQRPLFIIDLAVPRDVEPAVHNLSGVYLYDLDSLEAMAAKGLEARWREAELGEEVIRRHVQDFDEWMQRTALSTLVSGVMLECPPNP